MAENRGVFKGGWGVLFEIKKKYAPLPYVCSGGPEQRTERRAHTSCIHRPATSIQYKVMRKRFLLKMQNMGIQGHIQLDEIFPQEKQKKSFSWLWILGVLVKICFFNWLFRCCYVLVVCNSKIQDYTRTEFWLYSGILDNTVLYNTGLLL